MSDQPVGGATDAGVGNRIWTIPNLISFARLLGVPLFLYLFLVADEVLWAVGVLAIGGTSDWIDGFLARRLGQVSRLGELLDPAADRLYILATLLAFTVREVVPWQFTVALLARDLVLLLTLPVLRHFGYGPPPVHYVGKTATFILLFAFPVLLWAWGTDPGLGHDLLYATGWGLAWWGLVLYWLAGVFYLLQFVQVLRIVRQAPA
jgi:cardiolipin synthase (CMP-forming)